MECTKRFRQKKNPSKVVPLDRHGARTAPGRRLTTQRYATEMSPKPSRIGRRSRKGDDSDVLEKPFPVTPMASET
jgi:hypothetical protein